MRGISIVSDKLRESNADLINRLIDQLNKDEGAASVDVVLTALQRRLMAIYKWSPYNSFMFFDIFVSINDTDNTRRMIKVGEEIKEKLQFS
jgi:type II secretory pathway predicted ATPase ExeA